MKKNRFAFVIDRSGSMLRLRKDALKTLNENIRSIADGQKAFPDQQSEVAVLSFANTVNVMQKLIPVDLARELSLDDYCPDGGTALFDGVSAAVDELQRTHYDNDTSLVIIIVTDGAENASKFTSSQVVKKLMRELESLGNWTFAFMLPKGQKKNFVATFGVPEGNVSEWETTAEGFRDVSMSVNQSTQSYYQTRSTGARKTETFFANLGHVHADDLKKKLIDVTSNVRVMQPVGDEDGKQIRDFYAERFPGKTYEPGKLYYMLMKSEKVQPQKRLLIRDKNGKFFAGAEARAIIGLPNVECRLRPGQQAGFEVYVESTSYNRKVKRGMKMLHIA